MEMKRIKRLLSFFFASACATPRSSFPRARRTQRSTCESSTSRVSLPPLLLCCTVLVVSLCVLCGSTCVWEQRPWPPPHPSSVSRDCCRRLNTGQSNRFPLDYCYNGHHPLRPSTPLAPYSLFCRYS